MANDYASNRALLLSSLCCKQLVRSCQLALNFEHLQSVMAPQRLLGLLISIVIIHGGNCDTVNCSGNCECPSQNTAIGETCTLNCIGSSDQCIDDTLKCRTGDPCVVICQGDVACGGNFELEANGATDGMLNYISNKITAIIKQISIVTISCLGDEACKDNRMECGTGACSIVCGSESCNEETTVIIGTATEFQCSGDCNPSMNNAQFTKEPTPSPTQPTDNPTLVPTTAQPTISPTSSPTSSTANPTNYPSVRPTIDLKLDTTATPTDGRTKYPSKVPTPFPVYTIIVTDDQGTIIGTLLQTESGTTNDDAIDGTVSGEVDNSSLESWMFAAIGLYYIESMPINKTCICCLLKYAERCFSAVS